MQAPLEYYRPMRYWMPILALLLTAFFPLSVSAQVNGVPPSVTSFGFGGRPGFNGPPPSVTSLGPQGLTPAHSGMHQPPHSPGFRPGSGHHHQVNAYPYYVPYYVPYYPAMEPYDGPVADQSLADTPDDPDQYQGGPTIFDRRGPGTRAQNDYQAENRKSAVSRPPAPTPPAQEEPATVAMKTPEPAIALQPATILIFKDGHRQEVGNYAIVGSYLYDLTPGHRMKVTLSDLDLDATQKANDDQGIDFKLPELPNGN